MLKLISIIFVSIIFNACASNTNTNIKKEIPKEKEIEEVYSYEYAYDFGSIKREIRDKETNKLVKVGHIYF